MKILVMTDIYLFNDKTGTEFLFLRRAIIGKYKTLDFLTIYIYFIKIKRPVPDIIKSILLYIMVINRKGY